MNRRDLFAPKNVALAAGQFLGAAEDARAISLDEPDEVALLRLGWRAMATGWEILLPFGTPEAMEVGRAAFALLDALEDQLTVYREHSEVSRLNRRAFRREVRVERRLFALLELARQVTQETDGAFDVTAGALIKAWGFFRGPKRVPTEEERVSALDRVGMRHVGLNPERRTVRFLREGLEINLGSIGKGYALDRMAEAIASRRNLPGVLLHGGSSSVYAKGCPHGVGRGWRIRLRHPWIRERTLAQLWLRDRALGTSAATFQHLEHEGKKLGHVLDPRTGWPASGVASASVVAPTGALADALSTAFYVGGVELARRYCAAHPDVGAVLLLEGEREPVFFNLDCCSGIT
jgi:thiamine biosynthesis lipoprotein